MFDRKQVFRSPSGRSVMKPSMKDWVEKQAKNGCPISLKIYKNAGHSFHAGRGLHTVQRFGRVLYSGAEEEALAAYRADIIEFIKNR